jgi:hypothetical protein
VLSQQALTDAQARKLLVPLLFWKIRKAAFLQKDLFVTGRATGIALRLNLTHVYFFWKLAMERHGSGYGQTVKMVFRFR